MANSVGERDCPSLKPTSDITSPTFVIVDYLCFCVIRDYMAFTACRNEVLHLIVKGVPKACHAELCQKFFFEINKPRMETLTCEYFLFNQST